MFTFRFHFYPPPTSVTTSNRSPACEQSFGMPGARDQFQIHFHGHLLRLDFKLLKQPGHRGARVDHPPLAIEKDFHVPNL